jgi:hypothetical protein
MYAQGVTIAVLLASAGLAAIHLKDEEELEVSEKSRKPEEAWKRMVSGWYLLRLRMCHEAQCRSITPLAEEWYRRIPTFLRLTIMGKRRAARS